jgi:VCBS repeat-containing protein
MHKKLLLILALTILIASTFVGCGQASSNPSTLTILSITEGDVFVMKAGTDDWIEAEVEMSLEVGDTIKTGDGSGAEITFFDGSTIELQAGTEIEIASLDISPDTGSTTITLQQTIGTTISRVTKLLDPASSYEIETPTGVAAVRGSTMIVTVTYVTPQIINTWTTNQEGNIWFIGQGVELQVPEGRTCISISGQLPELMNDPPVAVSHTAITDEDTPVIVAAPGVLNNDSDPDVGDTLTVTAVNTSGTIGAVTAWDADGSFTYEPNGQFEYLQAGNSTTDSFTYTISDGNGGTDTATVTITINGVNDPPIAVSDAAITDEDTPVSVSAPGVLKNDSDPDVGDTLTVTTLSRVYNSVIGVAVTAWRDGSFTYDPNGQFEYLQAGSSTTDFFAYTVSDGNGGSDTATVTITINGVNDAPTSISLDNSSVAENQPSGTAVGNFSTTDPDTGDTFTYSLVSGEGDDDNASFTIAGSQLQTAASLDYGTKNSCSIRVRTTDSGTLYYEEAFIITVTKVNDPPVAVDDSATTPENTQVTIDVLNNDSDIDGDTLTVDSVTQGTHGSIINNGNNVTYTPVVGFNGTDSFTYTISDGNGGTDTASVTVTVTVIETLARINVQIDTGPTASIYIRDNTTGEWAIDEDTGKPVDGSNHETSDTIKVAGGHSYCVWVGAANVTYDVNHCPTGWSISTLEGGGEKACGLAAAGSNYPVHFTET